MSPSDEIRFLVVHGLLHLLGWRTTPTSDRQAHAGAAAGAVRSLAERKSGRGALVGANRAPQDIRGVEGGPALNLLKGGADGKRLLGGA